jgi:hypothetical protein
VTYIGLSTIIDGGCCPFLFHDGHITTTENMASLLDHYPAFLVEFQGLSMNHQAIYVDVEENTSGYLLQVVGTIQAGMKLEVKEPFHHPTSSYTFLFMRQVGWVPHSQLGNSISVCETVPPPAKQYNGGLRLVPLDWLRRCQEWTAEAIDALRENGVLKELGPGEVPLYYDKKHMPAARRHGQVCITDRSLALVRNAHANKK